MGKYHDRIIFSAESFDEAKLREVIEDVKKESLENFPVYLFMPGIFIVYGTYIYLVLIIW